jgi:hypothetical protein
MRVQFSVVGEHAVKYRDSSLVVLLDCLPREGELIVLPGGERATVRTIEHYPFDIAGGWVYVVVGSPKSPVSLM